MRLLPCWTNVPAEFLKKEQYQTAEWLALFLFKNAILALFTSFFYMRYN
jgi:hypothetical protein